MKYKNPVIEGKFIKRINRFIAEVEISGKIEKVHVRNTGRCKEIFIPGAKIFLEEGSGEKRKTKYSLIAVYKEKRLINVDSQIVNYVFEEGVLKNKVDFLNNPDVFLREKVYNKSRFDFYYEKGSKKGFIEIKGVTLEKDNQTMFPDAPTLRGQKHIKELVQGLKEGYENYIIFLIQMENTKSFRPHWETDHVFAEELEKAKRQGVKILAYDTIVAPENITLNKTVKVKI
ncbi:MAG: DNA/RNA nuclease SfsA [Eubacteriales bacterium]|nr:DNA/RNA nuclease SfsA [Eubacteriales bacterium]